MRTLRGIRRYLISFATGVGFAILAAVLVAAIGHPAALVPVDFAVAIFGLVFGVAFITGLNLGMPLAIKDVVPGEGTPVRPGTGVCCILFSLGVFIATPVCVAFLD